MRDFYSTTAQVIPVLMLALVWESRFLNQLSESPRRHRRDDPVDGVLFWTKPRVRGWIIFTVSVAAAELVLAMLVLSGAVPDSVALRVAVLAGLAVVLASLLTRAIVDIVRATRD